MDPVPTSDKHYPYFCAFPKHFIICVLCSVNRDCLSLYATWDETRNRSCGNEEVDLHSAAFLKTPSGHSVSWIFQVNG